MPAFVKSKVGSESGTADDEGTIVLVSPKNGLSDILLPTESVAIILEIFKKCFSDAYSSPVGFPVYGSNITIDLCHFDFSRV